MKNKAATFLVFCLLFNPVLAKGLQIDGDSDRDGLTDEQELSVYLTDPTKADTDADGYPDGEEVKYNYDPNKSFDDKLEKRIDISLKDQSLTYRLGPYVIKTLKVSTGDRKHPTPPGDFTIFEKKPLVNYKGTNYYYPNTRWNMMFKRGRLGNLYIHGAYWHNRFGQRLSHGCVNVSYADVEALYNWADLGTKVSIR